jgi:hypothetical protein
MPPQFTLPPSTRAAGTGNPPADMNAVIDALVALGAGYNVLNAAFSGGADPTGAADSTAAIQAAISACQTAGGGIVYLPPGNYTVTGLTISGSDVTLLGTGIGASFLTLKNASNAPVVSLTGTGTVNVHIQDISIDGNKANQTTAGIGISINTPYSTIDSQHTIFNVDLISTWGDGISITGDTRVVRMMHVRVRQAGASGYNLAGSDHQTAMCIADGCGSHGFVVYAGDPMFIGCKAFYCDSLVNGSAGFRVEGTGCYFNACEAQNNNESGWVIIGTAQNILLEGCAATSNGTNFAGAGAGVQVVNASNVSIVGGLFTEIPAGKQTYGISLSGTTTNTRALGFTAFGNVTAPYNDASSGTNYLEVVSKAAATTAVTVTAATITSLGSLAVPALDVARGARYVIRAFGTLTTGATPGTFTCDLRWGGTGGTLLVAVVSGTDTAALTASITTQPILIQAEVTFVTATTCVVWITVSWRNSNTATTATTDVVKCITAPVTVTTSSVQSLSLDWTWSNANDSITIASSAFDRVS